jgi:hypothetical protein
MKKTLLLALALCFASSNAFAAAANIGTQGEVVFEGHSLSEPTGGFRGLYGPSEADDAAFRAAIGAITGGTWDYYDARAGIPDLSSYNCVLVWANYAFFDNVGYGNALADFVDAGGTVILGAFCAYTSGNFLSGRIMDDGYAPVTGGFNKFAPSFWSGDFATDCIHSGVTSYSATFRDILTIRASGTVAGTFLDGNIAQAHNASRHVHYANGCGGFPLDGSGPDWPQVVANGCACSGPIATEGATWGQLKDLYR